MTRRRLVQVTKIDPILGLVYGFGRIGVKDPIGADLVWAVTVLPVPVGFEPYLINESYTGTRNSVGKGRWGQCYICTEDFPLSEMTEKNGRFYCSKNKCNEDLL